MFLNAVGFGVPCEYYYSEKDEFALVYLFKQDVRISDLNMQLALDIYTVMLILVLGPCP